MRDSPLTLLVIAYGNRLRRDDGAGIALAESVAATLRGYGHTIRLVEMQQLLPELTPLLADPAYDAALFFDCAVNGTEEVMIRRLVPLPTNASLGHYLQPQSLLTYARLLYGAELPSWLVTIGGEDFEFGEGFSAAVEARLARAKISTSINLMNLI